MTLPRLSTVQSVDAHRKTATTVNALISSSANAMAVGTRADLAGASKGSAVYLMEPGREGEFVFDSSNLSTFVTADTQQGIYVAPSTDATGASGAWVRKFSGPVNPEWWGIAAANTGAQNDTARAGMCACLISRGKNARPGYLSLEVILFPQNLYNFATTWDLDGGTFTIEGMGSGQYGGTGSVLQWPTSTTAVRIQGPTTTGDVGTRATATGATGSIIRNLTIQSSYSGVNGNYYGIHMRGRAQITNVWISGGFDGDGIYVAGDGAKNENCNNFIIDTVSCAACRNGIFVDGSDANAGTIRMGDCSSNRQWGVWDSSFLGNTYLSMHTATNTLGAYKTDDPSARNVFIGCYSEGDQPASSFISPTVVIGGLHGAGGVSTFSGYISNNGGITTGGNIVANGTLIGTAGLSAGPQSGTATDTNNYLDNTSTQSFLNFRSWSGGVSQIDGFVQSVRGTGMKLNGSAAVIHAVAGTSIVQTLSTGLWLWAGKTITNQSGALTINGVGGVALQFNGTTAATAVAGGFNIPELAAASVATPGSGTQTLFIDTADHKLKRKDSSGTVTIIA